MVVAYALVRYTMMSSSLQIHSGIQRPSLLRMADTVSPAFSPATSSPPAMWVPASRNELTALACGMESMDWVWCDCKGLQQPCLGPFLTHLSFSILLDPTPPHLRVVSGFLGSSMGVCQACGGTRGILLCGGEAGLSSCCSIGQVLPW